MSSKKKSIVWADFEVSNNKNKAICKICRAELAYDGGCTSNLRKHLQGVHKKNTDNQPSGSGVTKTLQDFGITSGRMCSANRKRNIDSLVCNVITENNLPFSFVESNSFRELLHYSEPNYKPMCRDSVKQIIKQKASVLKAEIKNEMKNCDYLSITTDCWTSINNESYMAITCSYIKDWKIKSPVLETKFLEGRHYADYLAEQLSESVRNWEIENRVVAIVHDNASNIKSIGSMIDKQYEDVPCAAHTLQICINNAMGTNKVTNHPISKTIGAANRLVSHFHHSTLANNELLKRQKIMNDKDEMSYKLILSVKTRWNSVCDMFERLIKLRWPVVAVLGDRNVTKLADARTLDLTKDQWGLMEEILPVLKKLKAANTILCGEKYVSISSVLPVLKTLITVHLKVFEEDWDQVKIFKKELASNIVDKFKLNAADTTIYTLAAALDPRYKNLEFIENEDLRKRVYESLAEMIRKSSDEMGDEPVAKRPKKTAEDDFFPEENVTEEDELTKYRILSAIDKKSCPLQWWANNENSLPLLARFAKKYLSIPATSVAAERHFSAAGRTITKARNRLMPETADDVLFVYHNTE